MTENNAQRVKPTLGRNLSLLLIPLVVLPAAILLLLALFRIQNHLHDITVETGSAIAIGQKAEFEEAVNRHIALIIPAASDLDFVDRVESFTTDPGNQVAENELTGELLRRESELPVGTIANLLVARPSDGSILLASDPSLSGENIRLPEDQTEDNLSGIIVDDDLDSSSASPIIGVFHRMPTEEPQDSDFLLVGLLSPDAVIEMATEIDRLARAVPSFMDRSGSVFLIFPSERIYEVDPEGGFVLQSGMVTHPALGANNVLGPRTFSYQSPAGETRIGASAPAFNGQVLFVIERKDVTFLESLADFHPVLLLVFLALGFVSSYVIYQTTQRTLKPLTDLSEFANRVSKGDLDFRVDQSRDDELGQLASSFNRMAEELGSLYQSLEDRVEERTKQIRTASEVARGVISIPNLDELLRQAVQLIKDRFGYDHVSIFLLDNEGANAILRETTTSGDEGLKTIGHRLPVGSPSLVGQVTESNQPKLVTGGDAGETDDLDELLPGARSEVAIPLQITGKSLGALAIQSYERDAFQKEDIEVLQTLADQLSAAIENARLAQASTNAAERARLVSEITSQISGLMDPEHVLRTTAQALHKALGDVEVEVRLAKFQEPSFDDGE